MRWLVRLSHFWWVRDYSNWLHWLSFSRLVTHSFLFLRLKYFSVILNFPLDTRFEHRGNLVLEFLAGFIRDGILAFVWIENRAIVKFGRL